MPHTHNDDITISASGARSTSPQTIVESDTTLSGSHNGGTCVHAGTYTIARGATSNGSVTLQPGAGLVVNGVQNGSVNVGRGAWVEVRGAHNGSMHVHPGGRVRVEPGGKLAGSLDVGGDVENAGTRGGTARRYGDGAITDLPGGVVKEPEIGPNGAHLYRW